MPDTALGKRLIKLAAEGPWDIHSTDDLKPGESKIQRKAVNEYVDLTDDFVAENGIYTVQVQRFGVTSDVASFEILPELFDLKDKEVRETIKN